MRCGFGEENEESESEQVEWEMPVSARGGAAPLGQASEVLGL